MFGPITASASSSAGIHNVRRRTASWVEAVRSAPSETLKHAMYGVCVPRCKYADTNEDSILCMSCESNVNSRRNNDSMFFICKGERDVYRDGGRTER